MRILRNYILREFFGPFFAALTVLTLVMLLGNLIRLADLIINKGVSPLNVGKLFILLIPSLLIYTMPIAVLTAILLSLGRLSSDNEIIAIKASGINIFRLIISQLSILALIFSLILFFLNDKVIPYAHFASRKTLNSIGIKNPTAALEAGTFIKSFEKYILFIYQIENNLLKQIRIYEPQPDNKPCRTIIAKQGEFVSIPEKNSLKLKLIDGTSDEPDSKGGFYKLNFKTLFLNLDMNKDNSDKIEKKPKDMNLDEIKTEINKMGASGIETSPLIMEFHKRIALAFSVIIFTILGCSLAMLTRKREKSINFSMAFGITLVYYLLLLAGNALAIKHIIVPVLAMWMPNIILAGAAVFLTIKICEY